MADTSILEKVKRAKRVYIIGNGGSYANAVHIANDLLAVGKPAFTLDPASLTASANDHGYETIYSRWLRTVGNRDDLLLALSGSGCSKNILEAIKAAQEIGMDFHLVTDYLRTRDMQQSEEDQLALGHELMKALRCS